MRNLKWRDMSELFLQESIWSLYSPRPFCRKSGVCGLRFSRMVQFYWPSGFAGLEELKRYSLPGQLRQYRGATTANAGIAVRGWKLVC